MVQILHISLKLENTLCSSMIACLLNNTIGGRLTFDSIGEDETI